MAESRLRKREKTLLRVKDELEKRVNERTLELVRVNKELEESREKLIVVRASSTGTGGRKDPCGTRSP